MELIFFDAGKKFFQTSEKRRELLNQYLESLLKMDTSISESDIVYTFLHCLLRDEHDLKIMREGILNYVLKVK